MQRGEHLMGAGPPFVEWREDYDITDSTLVQAGTDTGGGPLYVGRAWHEGYMLPVKVAPDQYGASLAWAGYEHSRFGNDFEVLHLLRGQATWVPASDGDLPPYAFPVGCTAYGDTVYVARVAHCDSVTPGRLIPSEGLCCISYGGQEFSYKDYQVLVIS